MTAAIATAAVVPVLASPSVRAELVTQLVMGETATVLEHSGEWLRVRGALDGYVGWTHGGYVRETDATAAEAWRGRADEWSDGVTVAIGGAPIALPLRARLARSGTEVSLPDGRCGPMLGGTLQPFDAATRAGRSHPPELWALERFGGSPYLWGGVTPWGVDCSGLVQTTFLARGTIVPRDSSAQAAFGEPVALGHIEPGDLLFFRSESGSAAITHVAFAAAGDTVIHSTIACGGVVHESFAEGTRAGGALKPRLAAARRFARRQDQS